MEKYPGGALVIANLVLVSVGILSLIAWAYVLYQYVWTENRQFDSVLAIVLLICLLPLIATGAFGALRLEPVNRIGLTLACVSIGFSLYALELFVLWAAAWLGDGKVSTWIDGVPQGRKDEVKAYAAQSGIDFDTRDSIEVLRDLRARGIDVVPAVYPVALLEARPAGTFKSVIEIDGKEVLPLGGISNKRTLLCNENGYYTSYRSDEHGFHNPEGLWSSEQLDVAVIGDSFAHGFCVRSEENFIALIRRRHPATLTLGMGGNGPIMELATIKEYLPPLKPKVVLWAYFGKNDLIELREETKSLLLLRYLKPGYRQGLASLQAQIDRALLEYVETEKAAAIRKLKAGRKRTPDLARLVEFTKLSALRSRFGLGSSAGNIEGSPDGQAADMALFQGVLSQAKATVESWGGSFYFLYLPEWERYALPDQLRDNRAEVLRAAAELGIPVIDIHEAFAAHSDVLSFFPLRRSGHYNAKGNAVVAEAVLQRLAR
jgi:hypothetical protein